MSNGDDSHNKSIWMTRRQFAWFLGVGGLFLGGLPATYLLANRAHVQSFPPTSRNLLSGSFAAFTAYQATVLQDVAARIIPTDDTPGATEAGVVNELDRLAAGVERYRKLYHLGVIWIDRRVNAVYKKSSFLELRPEEQEKILMLADTGELSYIEKIMEKLLFGESNVGRQFFDLIKKQTFNSFYTNPIGWQIVGYQSSPQWSGHPDYFRCE